MGVSLYNRDVVREAERCVADAITSWLSLPGEGAVVGIAPAGAGKSYALGSAVLAAQKQKLRIAVATPTNEQAFALTSDIADRLGTAHVTHLRAKKIQLPDVNARKNVTSTDDAGMASRVKLVVGTLAKLGDAFSRGTLSGFDVLLVDEAYQANSVQYYMIGDLAPRHLLMGDSGQLAPFSTAPEGDRWRGLDEDPLLTAVEVLRRQKLVSKEVKLPITRRLDPRGASVARAFYPGHEFYAAVQDGVRQLTLAAPAARARGRAAAVDRALELASTTGWAHVELPEAAVLTADEESIDLIVEIIRRTLARKAKVRCENTPRGRALRQADIAVAVSHNVQKDLLRAALQRAGLSDVEVNTANKLQGLTFELVIAWHPLSGLDDVDDFHLDPGRLCVMLTRHRQACIVVGRAGDRALVEGIPPPSPAYIGWESNPVLDGWYAHEGVFDALSSFRVEVA